MVNKKRVKSYTLSQETVQIIEAFSAHSGNSLSQSAEYLIHRGLENTQMAEQLSDRTIHYMNRFIAEDKKNTDRLIGVMIGQTRILGKLYGVLITQAVRSGAIKQEELETVFGSGIKKCMLDLKSNGGKDDE